MNNKVISPCSESPIMKGDGKSREHPFDINMVPTSLKDIVFKYLIRLQYLQLTIMELVDDQSDLREIGESMLQLEQQFGKLMTEIIATRN